MKQLCSREEADEIVERYANMVFKFALSQTRRKDLADDVFQEVFLRYVRKHPEFQNEEHAKAWFLTVTRNCCRNQFSSLFVRNTMPLVEDIPILEKADTSLYYYVMKLPKKYRTVIHLFYYEEWSTQQIATFLHKDTFTKTGLKKDISIRRAMC